MKLARATRFLYEAWFHNAHAKNSRHAKNGKRKNAAIPKNSKNSKIFWKTGVGMC